MNWVSLASDTLPRILTVAGFDPTGGAGLLADCATLTQLGAQPCGVVTSVVAQNRFHVGTLGLQHPRHVLAQLESVRAEGPVAAVKIGMLGLAGTVTGLADWLKTLTVSSVLPIVLDPVLHASAGRRLLSRRGILALRETLLPHVTVLTPNLPEAAMLLGISPAQTPKDMREQAQALQALMGPKGWVMLKGGHLAGSISPDILAGPDDGQVYLEGERLKEVPPFLMRGTGCRLSTALAFALAKAPHDVPKAARQAKAFVRRRLAGDSP